MKQVKPLLKEMLAKNHMSFGRGHYKRLRKSVLRTNIHHLVLHLLKTSILGIQTPFYYNIDPIVGTRKEAARDS